MNVLTDMQAVPGNLNAYLYKRSADAWQNTQASLKATQDSLESLNRFVEESRVIVNTGRAGRLRDAFGQMERDVRAIHVPLSSRFLPKSGTPEVVHPLLVTGMPWKESSIFCARDADAAHCPIFSGLG